MVVMLQKSRQLFNASKYFFPIPLVVLLVQNQVRSTQTNGFNGFHIGRSDGLMWFYRRKLMRQYSFALSFSISLLSFTTTTTTIIVLVSFRFVENPRALSFAAPSSQTRKSFKCLSPSIVAMPLYTFRRKRITNIVESSRRFFSAPSTIYQAHLYPRLVSLLEDQTDSHLCDGRDNNFKRSTKCPKTSEGFVRLTIYG